MFKDPDYVEIGGHPYKVSREKNLVRNRGESGNSCGNAQTIVLDTELTPDMFESTFIHEVLHQLDYVYNIGLEHKQVYQLEAAIFAFIKANFDNMKEEKL